MLGKKSIALVIVLFAAAVYLTGEARLVLDRITAPFREDFSSMIYLPRGKGLKVMACGFDAPLADALFIKGMIYYADSFHTQKKDADTTREYTYELFDVITDLSPRFTRAYQMGSLFLTSSSSLKSNNDGIALLQKGVDAAAAAEAAGAPIVPDGRWLFHTLIANTYETNVQTRLRQAGDIDGAAEARQSAGKEFRLAAASPGAPEYIQLAAAGYERGLTGKGAVEDSMIAVLSVWQYLYDQAKKRGDKDVMSDLESRIEELGQNIVNIRAAREIETVLSRAGKAYIQKEKHPPAGAADLARAGMIPSAPKSPLDTEDAPDSWLALPDGSFKSRVLSDMTTRNDLDILYNAALDFRRTHSRPARDAQELVDEKFIESIPEPPLKALGQKYVFNPKSGVFENEEPLGPELPPDRK